MSERSFEIKTNALVGEFEGNGFVEVRNRPVSPGLAEFHLGRPSANGEHFDILPGNIYVGRVDTTKSTLK